MKPNWRRTWRLETLVIGIGCLCGALVYYYRLYQDHYSISAEIAREMGEPARTSPTVLVILGTVFLLPGLWFVARAAWGPLDHDVDRLFDDR